jgi:hypothetical protein
MIYTIDTDDFLPDCSNVRYPLLRTIHSEFKANSNDKQGDQNATNIRHLMTNIRSMFGIFDIFHFGR